MSLTTYSIFYFGHTVDLTNNQLDFDEGGLELTAELEIGEYTLTEYAAEVERALNVAGALDYTVTVNRATRAITIAASGNFTLRVATGSHAGNSAFAMVGFTGANRTGDDSYTGNLGSGSAFEPQRVLQDYEAAEDNQDSVDESVSESASGVIQVVTFGTRRFVQMNVSLQTDRATPGLATIKVQVNAVQNLRNFLAYATTKAPVEFMADIDDPSTFQKLILESTPLSKNGTGFKLKERKDIRAPGYYDSGTLLWRVTA